MTTGKHPGGRPPALEPDEKTLQTVYGLGQIQCTLRECAAVLGVGEATFLRFKERCPEVAAIFEKGQQEGLASLRRAQFKKALEGNATMQIWLGKQLLGQVDRMDATVTQTVNYSETKTIRYELTDAQLLEIAAIPANDHAEGSGDGASETAAGTPVPRRLQ